VSKNCENLILSNRKSEVLDSCKGSELLDEPLNLNGIFSAENFWVMSFHLLTGSNLFNGFFLFQAKEPMLRDSISVWDD
jgi:hypothetical protein